jgi:tetratricopeptide (TPR) repeat protein
MNEPWKGLSKLERERVSGLSKDLYEISDRPVQGPEPMNPQAQGKLSEAYEARERGEWDRALELLRQSGNYVPAPLISYLRGTIWRAAGDAATAAVFFEHASQLDPNNENFQAVLLHTLKTAVPQDAAARAEVVLKNSEARAPAVVVYAADIIFGTVRGMSDAEAMPTYQRLIPIIEQTLKRMEGREDIDGSALNGMALTLLATCYEALGDTPKAYGYYSRAIQLDPTNDTLLIARGKLLYGTDPNAAADFEQAIRLGSSLVWPYFYLEPVSKLDDFPVRLARRQLVFEEDHKRRSSVWLAPFCLTISGNVWNLGSRSQRKTGMCSSRDENPVSLAGFLLVSSSFSGRAFPGGGFQPPAIFPPDKLACAAFGNGRKQAFGNAFSRGCLPNSRQPTRSIGIAHSWIAPRCARPAEAQKPAQIPRIGANWEASIICSPMPTASH